MTNATPQPPMTPASLIAARERLSLSQAAYAEALGIGRRTLQQYEAGASSPIPRYVALAGAALAAGIPPLA